MLSRHVFNYTNEQISDEYNYDGNRLTSVTSEGEITSEYFYQNDLLDRMVIYEDGDLSASFSFEYNENNVLVRYNAELEFLNSTYIAEFQYNGNNTIDVEYSYVGDTNFEGSYTLFLENRNIVRYVSEIETITFTYDSMKNAMANVFAADILILVPGDLGGTDLYGVSNNMLSASYKVNSENSQTDTENFIYDYNSNGYPNSAVSIYNGEEDGVLEYFYE